MRDQCIDFQFTKQTSTHKIQQFQFQLMSTTIISKYMKYTFNDVFLIFPSAYRNE